MAKTCTFGPARRPFDARWHGTDFGSMLGGFAEEKYSLKIAISEKLGAGGAGTDGQKADPKDQARDALKGLFKR